MGEKFKASRYNHFVEVGSGKRLAFNALSCGLAEMDDENYRQYLQLAGGDGNTTNGINEELLKNLKLGGFLIPDDVNELDALRAAHYKARFGQTGFGLTIIPTVNCNFACDYCYENRELHSLPARKGGVMSDEVCANIVKLCEQRIAEKSSFTASWYGGEPLIAKEIIHKLTYQFIRICEAKHSKYHAGIITNGYLLTEENLDFLIRMHVAFAQITIDGPRAVHDKRRCLKSGAPTYERIMANIQRVTEETPMQVSIRINVDKRNMGSVPELLDDFKSRGLHMRKNISFYFGQVVPYAGSCPDISAQCMVGPRFSEFLISANLQAIEMGLPISLFPERMISACGAIAPGSAVIEPGGRVQNCWNTIGVETAKTGNLTAEGIAYRTNYLKWIGYTLFTDKCESCDTLPLCMGGCPYKSIYRHEVTDSDDFTCASWKYNLEPMLSVIKKAKEKGLLVMPNRTSSKSDVT